MPELILYVSSMSASSNINKNQQKVRNVLDGKKITYTVKDIAMDPDAKEKIKDLRQKNPKANAVAPQLFLDDTHLGGYDDFEKAVEEEELDAFVTGKLLQ
ncbi:SH3 domain-binding glutamic acid-rich-like protein 3 [Babylonia areolata]|uniref:SH3 domain-binding glutamic acid-rich-like protein 3 n=1 Tax=Babylonia areolata TaxID=304850 RepID=UPI003FD5ADEC